MKRLLLVATLAGCLQVPHGPGSECSVDSDCNTAAGEVCEEGVCYGDPPTGLFAATLIAPIEREDLTSTEFPNLEIPRDGQLGDLQLEVPVKFSGRVEAAVQEDHVIDPVKPVRLETDDPGLTDACCSVGDWRQAGWLTVMILFGLRRRRAT